jgi:hypothetical protein
MKNAGAERADAQKQEKDEWILRVLGVEISPVADDSSSQAAEDIVGIWWDAKDSINEQIEALRHAILNTGHPLAARACENGLAGFSGGALVRFQATVIECRNAVPDAAGQARKNMEKYAAALTKYVSYNPVLALLEKNPFGIRLTIRQDVTRAVNSILQQAKS